MNRWLILIGAMLLVLWLVTRTPGPPVPPADKLQQRMQAAYTADKAPHDVKAQQKVTLVGLYEATAIVARQKKHEKVGDLLEAMHRIASQLLEEERGKPVALVQIRKEIVAGELAATLGTDPDAKLEPLRVSAVNVFNRCANALGGCK